MTDTFEALVRIFADLQSGATGTTGPYDHTWTFRPRDFEPRGKLLTSRNRLRRRRFRDRQLATFTISLDGE